MTHLLTELLLSVYLEDVLTLARGSLSARRLVSWRPSSHLLEDCCPCQRLLFRLLLDCSLALLLPQPCKLLPRQLPLHGLSSSGAHSPSSLPHRIGRTLSDLAVELVVLVRGELLELALLLRTSSLNQFLLSQPRAPKMFLRRAGGLFQHAPFCIGDAAMDNLVLVEGFFT